MSYKLRRFDSARPEHARSSRRQHYRDWSDVGDIVSDVFSALETNECCRLLLLSESTSPLLPVLVVDFRESPGKELAGKQAPPCPSR